MSSAAVAAKPKKKTLPSPSKAAPPKKKGATTFERRSPEQVLAANLGTSRDYHGVTLSIRDPKKAKHGFSAELLLKQLEVIPDFTGRTSLGNVDELARSIQSEGLISSLTVRPAKQSGKFQIIAGERRFKALKSIGHTEPVHCIIRPDLVGDDERALAVAVAENSEDGRTNLNMIETGRMLLRLTKKDWAVARIAKETALHPQRVRRALALVETPEDVQKNVTAGKWSVAAGLEYARLDPKQREKIRGKLTQATTAEDIKKFRKAAERDEVAIKVAKGEKPILTKKHGAVSRTVATTTWRASREKQKKLGELCHMLVNAAKEEVGTPGYYEVRGLIGGLLWDRGDRTEALIPDEQPDKNSDTYAADMKDLTAFNAVVKAEAAKYIPPEGASDGEGEEGGD